MKMLLFDYRKSEHEFFKNNIFTDIEITFFEAPLNENTILTEEELAQTDIISVFTTSNLNKDILSKFKNLRIVTTRSTSFSHIDLNYCSQHSIAVMNVENYGKNSVAELSLALMLLLIRKVLPAYNEFKLNKVCLEKYEGCLLSSLTLGIIGCGAIGAQVANMAQYLGMKVLVSSKEKNKNLHEECRYVSLQTLFEEADIISLHLPYTKDNYHLIGEKEFSLMKNGVYIVNTSRIELIDVVSLYNNIISGKVRGAGLDFVECEYLNLNTAKIKNNIWEYGEECIRTSLIIQKLINLDNVIITPHIGYNTKEAINLLLETTFNNIKDYIKGMNSNRIC